MQLELTDFQKDCLVKAKDQLNKIPRTESNIIRWNLMPGKVAVIVDLWKQSKLSAEAFADALMITKSLLPKFAKGRNIANEIWPEVLALLKPEDAEKNKVKKEKQKSEKVVEDAIFKILLRDRVKEIGLRTETITTEISSYPSRFVSTCLGRLESAGRLVKFKGEDKYTKWKVVDRKEKQDLKTTEDIPLLKSIDPIVPEIKIVKEPKIEKVELPGKEIIEKVISDDETVFYDTLKLEDLDFLDERCIQVRIPIEFTKWNKLPLQKWALVLRSIENISEKLAPDFEEYFINHSFLNMLKGLEKAKIRMKLDSNQKVIDHFSLIIDSSGLY